MASATPPATAPTVDVAAPPPSLTDRPPSLQIQQNGDVGPVAAPVRQLKRVLPTSPEEAELICEILAEEL